MVETTDPSQRRKEVNGDVGVCPPVYAIDDVVISEIYYNAKIYQLGTEYDNIYVDECV